MSSTLASEIAKQTAGKPKKDVQELILDKASATALKGSEFEGYDSLVTLSMNDVGLTTLDNFPTLRKLRRLELNDNKITGSLDALQDAALVELVALSLCNNRIKTLEDLLPLGCIPKLKQLDLTGCEVCKLPDYRNEVFGSIPSLQILDGVDQEGVERDLVEDDDDDDEEEPDDDDGDGFDDDEEEFDVRAARAREHGVRRS